jgi:hypothetical protein
MQVQPHPVAQSGPRPIRQRPLLIDRRSRRVIHQLTVPLGKPHPVVPATDLSRPPEET